LFLQTCHSIHAYSGDKHAETIDIITSEMDTLIGGGRGGVGARELWIVRVGEGAEGIRAATGSLLLAVGLLSLCGHFVVNLPTAGAVFHIPNNSWVTPSPYCMYNDHVHGRWVYNPDVTMSKEFVCCGYDREEDRMWNTTVCAARLVQDTDYYTGLAPPIFSLAGGHACKCDGAVDGLGRLAVRKRERYFWQPYYCKIERFEGRKFCDLLGSRHIAFVGDSTFMQQAVTLMSHITASGGMCAKNIITLHNNLLIDGTLSYHTDWVDIMKSFKASIVVLGFGAHHHSIKEYITLWDLVTRHVKQYHADEYIRGHNVTVILRTIIPPHLNCSVHSPVLAVAQEIEPGNRNDLYHWDLFPIFDDTAKRYATQLGWSVIDMSPLRLRPDAHPEGDCLHYCIPGPLSLFDQVLQTMLVSGELKL
jgi:hypothetical protein